MSKQNVRSLIRTVPKLVQSSLITQALALEKAIAATFEMSDKMKAALRNTPPNYLEVIISCYKDCNFKAFDLGFNSGCANKMDLAKAEDLSKEVQIKCPLPESVIQELEAVFIESSKDFLESTTNKPEIMAIFDEDLMNSYLDGIKEAMVAKEMVKEGDAPVINEVEVPTQEIMPNVPPVKLPEAIKQELQIEGGMKQVEVAAVNPNNTSPVMSQDAVLEKMKEYAKLLGPGVPQKVLEYYLGISPKLAQANTEVTATGEMSAEDLLPGGENYDDALFLEWACEDLGLDCKGIKPFDKYQGPYAQLSDGSKLWIHQELPETVIHEKGSETTEYFVDKMPSNFKSMFQRKEANAAVGPFDPLAIKGKVLDMSKSLKVDPAQDKQLIIVDVILDANGMAEKEFDEAVTRKLGLAELMPQGEHSHADVIATLDTMAEEITNEAGLPGEFCFCLDEDDNLALWFSIDTTKLPDLMKMSESVVTAANKTDIPQGPMGVVSAKDQEQLKELAKHTSVRALTMKQIKACSPALATYISGKITEFRGGKIQACELSRALNTSMADLIKEVYGADAVAFVHEFKQGGPTKKV